MRQNEIRALSPEEHVRQRPAMYVGATQTETVERWTLENGKLVYKQVKIVPALLKMFDEIISNSIDEAIRTDFKFANKIDVTIKNPWIMVQDNGRGIPLKPSPDFPGKTMAEVALTELRAGANFGKEEVVSIGTHGLGASLVNILSGAFNATTCDGKSSLSIECKDQMREIKTIKGKAGKQGTYVAYSPDFSFFDCNELSGDLVGLLEKRVFDLAVNFPKIKFTLNGTAIKGAKFRDYLAMVGDVFEFTETNDYRVGVVSSEQYNQISFVNGIDTYEGGVHVDWVRNKVIDQVLILLDKKYKKLKLDKADVKNHLTFVVMSNAIKAPKFRSQTKEHLSNAPQNIAKIFQPVEQNMKFIKAIVNNEKLVDKIIETKRFRIALEENRAARDAQKAMKKIRVAKHIPANGHHTKTTLFITEGDSAIGPFTKARNPELHGAFPLRGKPMNTFGRKAHEILENKELTELMAVLGLRFGDDKDTILNYQNIAIMSDADYDGYSIMCSMLAFFAHWPWLFDQNRIHIVRCPIMKLSKGKENLSVYSLETYKELVDSKKVDDSWSISYKKGLGSLTPEEYEEMINRPVKTTVQFKDAPHWLDIAFGPDPAKRKVWLAQ